MGIFRRDPSDLQAGEATVLFAALTPKASRQTGKRNLEHEVKLAVDRPEGGRRELVLITTVPWDRPLGTRSREPVRVSPTDPDYVEIDFENLEPVTTVGDAALEAAREGRAPTPSDLGFTPVENTED